LLAGDLILPELVKIFSDNKNESRSELIYYMSRSEALSKNIIAAWILDQSAERRLHLIGQLNSDDKSGFADLLGKEFKYIHNVNGPEGIDLLEVSYSPHEGPKIQDVKDYLALPKAEDILSPQFISMPSVEVLLRERSEVQKRLLSYDRNSLSSELTGFIEEKLFINKVGN
jgi:hypothetical protein